MSRCTFAISALLVGLLLSVVPAVAREWPLYTAPDGRFSVRFPVTPEEADDNGGRQISSSPTEHETYIVEYTPLDGPKEYMSDKLFDAAKKSFTDGGGTILEVDIHKVVGHPAQDVEIRAKEGYIAWDRLVAVNDRVYQLLFITDRADGARPTRFWASFKLNP